MKIKGFTVTEIIFALTILAVLAAVAIPNYQHYTAKSYYAEVVELANRYKLAVGLCLDHTKGVTSQCGAGMNGVPANISSGSLNGMVDSITVVDGTITVVPKNKNGVKATDTYQLVPTYSANGVAWTISGGGCSSGLTTTC